MPQDLQPVWNQIVWLHDSHISLIPVRDKPEGDKPAKTPFQGWKKYQSEIIELNELWGQMETHKTNAVALLCGRVSLNLEIIDIDVKYKPGIDAVLLSDLKSLYPDIFARLRIHKTPSGGYHILYRVPVDATVPGNKKLAGRAATQAELTDNPKGKTKNFIETRGEGGYAVAPPSLNYLVHIDNPIPILTWEERCSIISLCQTYSELVDIVPTYKPTKSDESYYDENPFDHFNNSPEAEMVLMNAGWKLFKQNNIFIWFTHPTSKNGGVHASFHKIKKVYFIFTSSTIFDESKGYNPATALSMLEHDGDKKKTYQYLVQKGYGKIKPSVEHRIAKNKAAAGRPLPANASEQAKIEYAAELVHLQYICPHGVFWETGSQGTGKVVNIERLLTVAEAMGFRFYQDGVVLIEGYIVRTQEPRDYFDTLKKYIKEEDTFEYIDICCAFETFVQKKGEFSITRLPKLDTEVIVKDTKNTAFKFYNNGYLYITASEFSFHSYDNLSGLIWDHFILKRSYQVGKQEGRYIDFISLATPYAEQAGYIRRLIGFLAHQYKDETTGYIIVLTESCPDPKQGGGSGKNVFSSLMAATTTYKSIPGSQVRYDEKFMQSWNGERIFAVSDVPRKFNFSFLKELSTGGGILKKLWADERSLEVNEMPKYIIQTNFSYEVSDGGLKRRLMPLEFTDYFTKCGGVDVHFGCHFPNGWDTQDWIGYDNFIAACICDWLSGNLKLSAPALTDGGWKKQFEQTWGSVITSFIEEKIDGWMEAEWVEGEKFKGDLDEFYRENNTPLSYRPATTKIYLAIAEYCRHNVWQFENNIQHRNTFGFSTKHKWFTKLEAPPF